MKKFNILFIAMALMFLGTLPSCDFLDVVPDEKATEADAFADKEAARRFLYSCYAYLPQTRNGTSSLDFMTADEVVTPFEHETFANFPKGTYSSSNPVISYWNTLFSGLKQCYLLINNIASVPQMDEATKADYVAQAKFLIGYYHLLLVRCYGPVILIKEEPALDTPASEYAARSPYDECVQFVCDMLDEAAAGLPATRAGQSYGLATSVAAKSLKARMLLYAASPLFNGNSEYYSEFTDKEGNHLIPQTYDAAKWAKAKTAYEEAITAANAAGFGLYEDTDDEFPGTPNAEPVDPIQHRLRYVLIMPGNKEIIWSDSREEGYYGYHNKAVPYNCSSSSAWGGVAPTLTMLERFYTDKGLPIDVDPDFPKGASRYNLSVIEDETIGKVGARTTNFNLNREPRFYSWIAFQGGFFEIISNAQNGAYDEDPSYWEFSTEDRTSGKLVCDFVLGGNTSRKRFSENKRDGDYSPSGYLTKKGVVPGYAVNTGYSTPPFYSWPLVRMAELYLGCAEACIESGDLTNGKKYLNMVRERAGIPTVETSWEGIAELNQNKLREIVRQERMIELFLENHLFWDLRRWKIAHEYLDKQARGMNIMAETLEEFAQETVIEFARGFRNPANYLMPIPAADVNRNMNLVQNPGY